LNWKEVRGIKQKAARSNISRSWRKNKEKLYSSMHCNTAN